MGKTIFFICGVIIGFLLAYPFHADDPEIKIVKEYEPVVRYKYETKTVYADPELLKACYNSPIHIEPTFSPGQVEIFCNDACKQTSQRFDIEIGQNSNYKLYIGLAAAGAIGGLLISRFF